GPVTVPSAQTLTWQAPELPSARARKLLTWQPPKSPERFTSSQVPEDPRSGPAYRSSQEFGSQSTSRPRPGLEVVASGSLLDRASELANLGRHEAVALCEQVVRQQGPSAPA